MNLKRRLLNLECRPFRRPVAKTDNARDREIQRKLCLPLPAAATPEEFSECIRLMQSAQQIDGESGWNVVRDYALSLHRKYGTNN